MLIEISTLARVEQIVGTLDKFSLNELWQHKLLIQEDGLHHERLKFLDQLSQKVTLVHERNIVRTVLLEESYLLLLIHGSQHRIDTQLPALT